jgi:hypothetical protein
MKDFPAFCKIMLKEGYAKIKFPFLGFYELLKAGSFAPCTFVCFEKLNRIVL